MRLLPIALMICLLWVNGPALSATLAEADSGAAVILAYHRIGEDSYPDLNTQTEQFEAHIAELSNPAYHILPLGDVVKAIKLSEKLPPRSIAVTFEGGYRSILDRAVPLLLEKNIPFTVFYAADLADGKSPLYLNWNDLAMLKKNPLVTLGILPAAYTRLAGAPQEEILRQINRARSAHQEHFGSQPTLFSYPFGEYSLAYRNIIEAQQFDAAFGQHSGAAYSGSDLHALPRFSITEIYGDAEQIKFIASSLPLPTFDVIPEDPYLASANTNAIGFSVPEDMKANLIELSCFVSHKKDVAQEFIGNRFELRTPDPITEARTLVNCTLPGPEGEDGVVRWRWFGMLLINPVDVGTADTTLQQDEPQ